ncbi:MAG: DNA methyltransferase [Cytophagales bacterium]|nr:DNA methyltransferase [Cytophagales bacterium]
MICNVKNRSVFCEDNIDVLEGVNNSCIDLIYLDPPFNKNDTFVGSGKRIKEIKNYFLNLQETGKFLDEDFEEIFHEENPASFKDIWKETDINLRWYTEIGDRKPELIPYLKGIRSFTMSGGYYYLIFMAIRILEMHRILKDTGSVYLHCDPTMSHYLKGLMDVIFGKENFRNEIVWAYRTGGVSTKYFPRKHDIILCYVKTKKASFHPSQERIFYEKPFFTTKKDRQGRWYSDVYVRDTWDTGNGVESSLAPLINVSRERVGYPTQKPLALLERIIQASSNKGDMVLDPFCGCATTCLAAEGLNRQWIGIDWGKPAYYMLYYRLRNTHALLQEGKAPPAIQPQKNLPQRSDITEKEQKELAERKRAKDAVSKIRKDKKPKLSPKDKQLVRDLLYEDQTGMCAGCDVYMRPSDLTLDHIFAQAKGGEDDLDNLQLLCYRCNVWKSDESMMKLFEKLLEEGIISKGTYNKQVAKWRTKEKEIG